MSPAFDHEAITVSTTAIGPTTATRLDANDIGANSVEISIETSDVRVRWDGTNPTASTGHKIPAGTMFALDGAENISKLKMIRDTAESVDAVARLTYNRS